MTPQLSCCFVFLFPFFFLSCLFVHFLVLLFVLFTYPGTWQETDMNRMSDGHEFVEGNIHSLHNVYDLMASVIDLVS